MKRHLLVGGFVSLAVSGAAMAACGSSGGGGGADASSGASTFTDVYTQILQPSCGTSSTVTTAGCHQAAADVPPSLTVSNLDMSSEAIAYTNLVNVRGMGTYCSVPEDGSTEAPFRVLPGNAQESLLYIKVAEAMPPCGVRMPRPIPPASTAEPLTDAQITLIADWINAGALNSH